MGIDWDATKIAERAMESARRLKSQEESYNCYSELAIAEDIRSLMTATLETIVNTADEHSLERYLVTLQRASFRQKFQARSLLLLLFEVEDALADIIQSTEGAATLGSAEWRSIQALLRYTVVQFAARLSA